MSTVATPRAPRPAPPLPAPPPPAPPEAQTVPATKRDRPHRLDRLALHVWVVGAAILALLHAYDWVALLLGWR